MVFFINESRKRFTATRSQV